MGGHQDIVWTMIYPKGIRNSDIQRVVNKGSLAAFAWGISLRVPRASSCVGTKPAYLDHNGLKTRERAVQRLRGFRMSILWMRTARRFE